MKTLGKMTLLGVLLALFSVKLMADMNVIFDNRTTDYAIYLYSDYHVKIAPGQSATIKLKEHDSVVVGMDNKNPTAWKTFGLGYGGVSYSTDPSSGQSNFSFGLGPASASDITTEPPYITLTGGVQMEGRDDWKNGISLQPHGNSDDTTITFKE